MKKVWPDVTEQFARQEVGPRLFGKRWIPGLTEDARHLLKTYGLLGEAADVSDLLRQQEKEKDAPDGQPTERQELMAARLQQALMLTQRQQVDAWLDSWALRKYPGRINRAQLEAALAAAFPQAEAEVNREPVCCTPDETGRLDVAKGARWGRPNTTKARVREYLDQKYPNGTDATVRSLVDELEAAKIFASPTTVQRALGRRRDSDRSSKVRPK